MGNRKIDKILIKKSGVVGKIPTALELGELAINFADVKLYASGTTANSIIPIGWDRISRTGDTVTGNFNFNGVVSATTISAVSYIGLPTDLVVTGGTYAAGTAVFTNNTGGTFNVTGFSTGGSSSVAAFTGNTSVDFGFSGGLENDFASTSVSNTNILSTSSIIYRVTSSTDHNESEDSLLEGLLFKESDIVNGVGFTLNVYALNNTWGVYNIFYKIIN